MAAKGLQIGARAAHSGSSTTLAYLGDVFDEWRIPGTEFLEARVPSHVRPGASTRMTQATLRRTGRGAGLLGARFTPVSTASDVLIRVALGQARTAGVYDTAGLAPDEARVVLDGLEARGRSSSLAALGPGLVEVLWASSHPIDSSASGFARLSDELALLLALPPGASADDVVRAWRATPG